MSKRVNERITLSIETIIILKLHFQLTGSLDGLRKYPNANILLGLVEQAPEAIQTVLYTVLTQQEKVRKPRESRCSPGDGG